MFFTELPLLRALVVRHLVGTPLTRVALRELGARQPTTAEPPRMVVLAVRVPGTPVIRGSLKVRPEDRPVVVAVAAITTLGGIGFTPVVAVVVQIVAVFSTLAP